MFTKNLNARIFSKYTRDSCYWAGLLAADGSIDINGTLSLELNSKDKHILDEFKEFCCSDHLISYRESADAYRIRFCNKEVVSDLLYNFSVSTDKTHNLIMPILEESWQYACYYRGFFDGDGCFSEFFNNRPMASYRVFLTSGSIGFLEDTVQLLRDMGVIVGGSISKKAANCWHIQLGVKDAASFLRWIYSEVGPKLTRKYNKYHNIIVLGNRATR